MILHVYFSKTIRGQQTGVVGLQYWNPSSWRVLQPPVSVPRITLFRAQEQNKDVQELWLLAEDYCQPNEAPKKICREINIPTSFSSLPRCLHLIRSNRLRESFQFEETQTKTPKPPGDWAEADGTRPKYGNTLNQFPKSRITLIPNQIRTIQESRLQASLTSTDVENAKQSISRLNSAMHKTGTDQGQLGLH